MTTASSTAPRARSQAQLRRLVRAELLKLRRRRSLLAASAALIVAPVLLSYLLPAVLHVADPVKFGPAGGTDSLAGPLQALTVIGAVAVVLVGVSAGGGDLGAGVFRELVVTGRSRLALFVARIPGGLALSLPFVALALAIAAVEPWFEAHTYYSGEVFVVSALVALPALVLGIVGWRRTSRGLRGKPLAVAAAVLSALLLASYITFVAVLVVGLWGSGGD
jgi:hypothetical protein